MREHVTLDTYLNECNHRLTESDWGLGKCDSKNIITGLG